MSYCVNCGVELNKSEKYCPLCNVEVINPKEPWKEPMGRPYPHHAEKLVKRIDQRYFASLMILLLSIPVIMTILANLMANGKITWSAYVVGAIALVIIFTLMPLYFKKYHTVIFLTINCIAALLYLFFIESANGGQWFMGIGMPITVTASICIIAISLLFTKKPKLPLMIKTSVLLIAAGVFVTCVELFLKLHLNNVFEIRWAHYVVIPCAVLSIAAVILEHRKNFKEIIRRKLFY